MLRRPGLLVVVVLLAVSPVLAGTTGKIKGNVVDAETGDPLPFANVLLKNSLMGAAADGAGEYYILNVPVGEYTLQGSMMGYADIEVQGVRVSADLTTFQDLKLSPEVLKSADVVEIIADRPMVDRGITASTTIVEGDVIEAMPVSDFTDVMAAQAGVSETGAQRSRGMHVRGGRSGEITYVVDGVNTTDPVTNTRGITLDNNAIAEMTMLSGGFNAEYGEAMSGVVNIVTKEGGSEYHGGAEYYTDRILGDRYDYDTNDANFNMGGPIPFLEKRGSFFLSGSTRNTDDRAPSVYPQPYNGRWQDSGTAKLRFNLTPAMKLVVNGNWSDSEYHRYSHQRARGNWLKDQLYVSSGNTQLGATLTHSLGASTFYTVNIARFKTSFKFSPLKGAHYDDFKVVGQDMAWVSAAMDSVYYSDVGWVWYDIENQKWHGLEPEEVWKRYYEGIGWCTIDSLGEMVWDNLAYKRDAYNRRWFDTGTWEYDDEDNPTDIVYVPFDADAYLEDVANSPQHRSDIYQGDIDTWYRRDRDEFRHFYYDWAPWWHDRNTTHWTVDVALTHQLGNANQVKTGAFLRKSTLKLTDLQFYNSNPYSDRYRMRPTNAAVYLQDKIEFEDLTLNAGLRWDYFDPAAEHFVDMEDLDSGSTDADPKDQFSPRLGLSFAVSDKSILYASYGHFFQPVELGELYQSLNADVTSGLPLLGNPDLPPEQTIAYEVGIRHTFSQDLAGEITAYYKDVRNLLSTREIISTLQDNPVNYTIFLIDDFAVVKGVDLSITKRARDFLSGTIGYSYLDAKGSGSSAREFYYLFQDTETPLPLREYPLEFDITHTFRANLNVFLPKDFGPFVLGIRPMADINANMQFRVASGPPYTPTDSRGNPGELGSGRLPSTQAINLRIDKHIAVGRFDVGLFMDVRNLLDNTNIADVHSRTGLPDDDGNHPRRESYTTADEYLRAVDNWRRYSTDPEHYDRPRTLTVGATLDF